MTILIHNTQGIDEIERASLAFVVANTAVAAGQTTTVLLTIDGVRMATEGCCDELGYRPLASLRSMNCATTL